MSNDFRLNYSRTDAFNAFRMDQFGGAVPVANPLFPSGFNLNNASLFVDIFSLTHGAYETGIAAQNAQRQINLVDSFQLQTGPHSIKIGVDYRRLRPHYGPGSYSQGVFFSDVSSAEAGNAAFALIASQVPASFRFQNLGAYAQDTWRIGSRLSLTYGVRWTWTTPPKPLTHPAWYLSPDSIYRICRDSLSRPRERHRSERRSVTWRLELAWPTNCVRVQISNLCFEEDLELFMTWPLAKPEIFSRRHLTRTEHSSLFWDDVPV